MRLFISINIPGAIRNEIAERLLQKIPKADYSVVGRDKLHYTLCFIGEASEERAKEIQKNIEEIKFAEFEVEISGIGCFGNRVVWLGAMKGANEMSKLAIIVTEKCEIKDNRFSPHLTLCRNMAAGKIEIEKLLEKLSKEEYSAKFLVSEFCLMESRLSPEGSAYRCISEIRLAGNK